MNEELKKELGMSFDEKIPGDYSIPFYIHEQDMCRLDMSHKRVEKMLIGLLMGIITVVFFVKGVAAYGENSKK